MKKKIRTRLSECMSAQDRKEARRLDDEAIAEAYVEPAERIADALEAIAEHLEGIRAILGERQ